MSEPTLWWLVTGAIVAAELLTGTFYLLMLAIGMPLSFIADRHYAGKEDNGKM